MSHLRSIAFVLLVLSLLVPSAPRADDMEPVRRRFTRVPAPDGIQIRRYNKTDGESPGKKDRVLVHYRGTLDNGDVFDSSFERRRPVQFSLEKVIPCWKVALQRLHVGEKAQIICPAAVGYGAKGSPPDIPGFARLTFEVELIEIL